MNDLSQLIRLNVELEGALRVLQARPDSHTEEIAREKLAALNALFDTLLPADAAPAAEPAEPEPQEQVKEDEAVAAEEAPAPEPDTTEMPAGPVAETDLGAEISALDETAQGRMPRPDIRRSLTINDKFLFRRVLFGGSDAEFNDTLDLITAMHSLDEAREYLLHDMAWDPDNDVVKEFMSLVESYFNSLK